MGWDLVFYRYRKYFTLDEENYLNVYMYMEDVSKTVLKVLKPPNMMQPNGQ